MIKIWRILTIIVMSLGLMSIGVAFITPQDVLASCDTYNSRGPDPNTTPADEICTNTPTGSTGTAVYNCGTYQTQPGVWEQACYRHDYNCTAGCGQPGGGGGGGGGGGICNLARIDCPVGSTRGTTVVGNQCENYSCASSIGSAQQVGSCCNWTTFPKECGDWYDCPTPGNPNKVCRDCTQEPPICAQYNYEQYNCVSTCSNTAPSNLVVTQLSPSSASLSWTPGSGGTEQRIYIGIDKLNVESNCAGGGCITATVPSGQSTYNTGNVLAPGTVYYYRVVNYESASCIQTSSTVTNLASCSLSPTAISLAPGNSALLTAVVNSSTEIERVDFVSNNPTVATVSPSSDTTYPYETVISALTTGSAVITATVYSTAGTVSCQTGSASFPGSQNTNVTVINVGPWWQVRDGDVTIY